MRLLILVATLLAIAGCASKLMEVRKSCKAGVESYDDGDTTFKCYSKENK